MRLMALPPPPPTPTTLMRAPRVSSSAKVMRPGPSFSLVMTAPSSIPSEHPVMKPQRRQMRLQCAATHRRAAHLAAQLAGVRGPRDAAARSASRARGRGSGTGGNATPSLLHVHLRVASSSEEVRQPAHEAPGDLAEGPRRRRAASAEAAARPVAISPEHEADRGRVDRARHHVHQPADPGRACPAAPACRRSAPRSPACPRGSPPPPVSTTPLLRLRSKPGAADLGEHHLADLFRPRLQHVAQHLAGHDPRLAAAHARAPRSSPPPGPSR